MDNLKLLPYKQISLSATGLSHKLGAKRINLRTQAFSPRKEHVIINWGNSSDYAKKLERSVQLFLNKPEAVALSVNKIAFYGLCSQHKLPGPTWTTLKKQAQEWAQEHVVVARTLVEAHAGRGIIIVEKGGVVPDAKVYTLYVPKRDEFRIHVARGNIVDIQQKKLRNGIQEKNYKVRSHSNGWIFARNGIKCPDVCQKAALDVMGAIGLDFGAIDVGYMQSKDRATVYEVNTAPGIEGTTLDIYAKTITKIIRPYVQTDVRKGRFT